MASRTAFVPFFPNQHGGGESFLQTEARHKLSKKSEIFLTLGSFIYLMKACPPCLPALLPHVRSDIKLIFYMDL